MLYRFARFLPHCKVFSNGGQVITISRQSQFALHSRHLMLAWSLTTQCASQHTACHQSMRRFVTSVLCMQTRNPSKDLPIGIVGSLMACSALYAGLALTLCLMVRLMTMPMSSDNCRV